jgi:hypothetical protein
MKTDVASRADVLARLRPYLPTLDKCFHIAWERWTEWLKKLDGSPADVSTRSRASILYDFIAAEAVRAFLGTNGVQVRRERGYLVLRFTDRVALRFKKFQGNSLRVSMSKTKQAELFGAQKLEFPVGSLKPMTHVIAGYLLDGLALDISRLAITCTCDGVQVWAPIDLLPARPKPVTIIHAPAASAPKPTVRSTRKPQRQDRSGSS